MQPDREGGRMDDDMQQQQDRRLKGMQGENQPPQQPQKCPRCDSFNTKFCYYNNYSLSQPRYFCKTCRRYWTQGGTLRNVPVGGGCRKGKRTKTSNSGENSNSRSQPPPPPAAPMQQQAQQIVSTTATPALITSPALRKNEPTNLATLSAPPQSIAPMNSYYSGGGFLSSLAAIQSLNPPQGFNQSINVGGGGNFGGGSSNMALLQGFNVPTFSSQQHHQQIQQGEFFQMGTRDNKNIEVPLYPSHQEALIPPSRTASSHQADWHQGFINSTTNPTPSNPGLWSSIGGGSTTTTTTGNNNSNAAGSSMNPYQWPDLPGYGPPP